MGDETLWKIGQFADLAKVSQRTVDYYTKLGLIQPEQRTSGNFRLYGRKALERLQRIEMLKAEKYTLEEIKQWLDQFDRTREQGDPAITEKLNALHSHMKQLEIEIKELEPYIETLKPNQAKNVFKVLTPQSAACIEAILLILGKGPLM
ncbi:MerR family transcriptional regulator [Marinicrinis sediminis]|uniref:MerR family transcriptional regulator n=1 Tax=Marinicrinis sediminis TaxID=1652465 RepID=A0ABW5RAU7_9BACL